MPRRLHLTFGHAWDAKQLRNELRAWLREAGINGTIAIDIVLSANEPFINAVEHPTDKASNAIEVIGDIADNELVLRIRDHGRWQPTQDPSQNHYGHDLIRHLMTDTAVQPTPSGTTITLRRTLP